MRAVIARAFVVAFLLCTFPHVAHALIWSDLGAGLADGWTHRSFVAEGQIGTAATSPGSAWSGAHEADVGKGTSGSYTTHQFRWSDRAWYNFELRFDGDTATWTMDKGGAQERSASYSAFNPFGEFDGLTFRLRASDGTGNRISLRDITLNSVAVGSGTISWQPPSGSSDNHYWALSDTGSLSSGFVLGGQVQFDWSNSHRPRDSQLSFYIKGADAPDTPPIPEPGTLTMLGMGVAGFAAMRRRKQGR
jgi:hypothetical protein